MVERLIISRNAYTQIDNIIDFNNYRNQSQSYSTKFLEKLFKTLDRLMEFPLMGIKTSKAGIFLLIWDQYYIYYKLSETSVEIESVRHQKENVTR